MATTIKDSWDLFHYNITLIYTYIKNNILISPDSIITITQIKHRWIPTRGLEIKFNYLLHYFNTMYCFWLSIHILFKSKIEIIMKSSRWIKFHLVFFGGAKMYSNGKYRCKQFIALTPKNGLWIYLTRYENAVYQIWLRFSG